MTDVHLLPGPAADGTALEADAAPSTPRWSGRRIAAWVAGTAAILASVVAIALSVFPGGQSQVRWAEYGYHIHGPESVTLEFDLAKPRDWTMTCTVSALAASHAQVGVNTVTVGPAEILDQRVIVDIATTQEAVTAVVDTCERVTN